MSERCAAARARRRLRVTSILLHLAMSALYFNTHTTTREQLINVYPGVCVCVSWLFCRPLPQDNGSQLASPSSPSSTSPFTEERLSSITVRLTRHHTRIRHVSHSLLGRHVVGLYTSLSSPSLSSRPLSSSPHPLLTVPARPPTHSLIFFFQFSVACFVRRDGKKPKETA